MDKNSISGSVVPAQTTIPEEDATLLAIEALEARSIDQHPRPLNAPNVPRDIPVAPRHTVAPPAGPKVIGPVVAKPVVPVSQPVVTPKPVISTPPHTEQAPTPQTAKPAPVTPPKPKRPLTPAEAITEALANAPASKTFQFFTNHQAPRKPFIIIGITVVVIGAGVAAYFLIR